MKNIDRILEEYSGIQLPQPTILKVDTADNWIQQALNEPIPKKLFGNLWLQGELSILYADTGIGKTILAVQIADNICNGKKSLPFENETPPQKVLFLDFELTRKQFQMRYACSQTEIHRFNGNFLRAEICFDEEVNDELIMEAIENEVANKQVKVVVIDNITYLKTETEKGSNALPLMKHLNRLKKEYGLSILVLAHTPKRDESRPITINDLYGSKMISNFIDGAFAMGRCSDAPNMRYIKQIKCRSSEMEFHAENVVVLELLKVNNMTQFTFIDFTHESIHLKQLTQAEDNDLTEKVYELSDKGYKIQQIADEIGRSLGYVHRRLKRRQ